MNHTYNDRDTCTTCGCSKTYIESNGIECVAPKMDLLRLKPKLNNSDIHNYVSKFLTAKADATNDELKALIYEKRVFSYNPAEYDWFINEWHSNRERWIEIYNNIENGSQPIEYEEEKWKPKTVITIERNPITGNYKIISIKQGSKST